MHESALESTAVLAFLFEVNIKTKKNVFERKITLKIRNCFLQKISETDNVALEPFLRIVGDEIFTNSKFIRPLFFWKFLLWLIDFVNSSSFYNNLRWAYSWFEFGIIVGRFKSEQILQVIIKCSIINVYFQRLIFYFLNRYIGSLTTPPCTEGKKFILNFSLMENNAMA